MKKLVIAFTLIGIIVLFSSCQKVPQAEIDVATAAVQEVKDAGADLYVPEAYSALVDSMKSATEKVETAKAKWFPNYKPAKELLAVVSQMAVDTKAKSESRKVELKAETEAMIVEVKALVEEDKALITKAPKGKEGREASAGAIKSDLTVAETTVTEVEGLLANGDWIGSNDKIKAAKEKTTSIKGELEEAIAKKGGKTYGNDRDFDGVPDDLDKCPTISGSKENYGCPIEDSRNPTSQDTISRKAQLGFSYYKVIQMEETRDFRVNVVVKGTRSAVKSNLRRVEKQELEYADLNDSSVVCYIDNIDVYNKLKISLEANANDFEISPFDTLLKEEQELDFKKGNYWHWKVRAVSKIEHKGYITLRTEAITPSGVRKSFTPKVVNIGIVISHPVSPESWRTNIFNWFIEKIDYIASAIVTAFAAYLINKLFKKKNRNNYSDS